MVYIIPKWRQQTRVDWNGRHTRASLSTFKPTRIKDEVVSSVSRDELSIVRCIYILIEYQQEVVSHVAIQPKVISLFNNYDNMKAIPTRDMTMLRWLVD